jgi:endonuclease/exonuclease/phosphatase family metal-dependent hydrolase
VSSAAQTHCSTVLAWNCADQFQRKAHLVRHKNPDLLVLPEVQRRDRDALGAGYNTVFIGPETGRGLLVAAREPGSLTLRKTAALPHAARLTWLLNGQSLGFVALWAKPERGSYIRFLCETIKELSDVDDKSLSLVLGDFNASKAFDRHRTGRNCFERVAEALQIRGLRSIWHQRMGEPFGEESKATYFHQWKTNQSFHIDYVFGSSSIRRRVVEMTIEEPTSWLKVSDHVPLFLKLSRETSDRP